MNRLQGIVEPVKLGPEEVVDLQQDKLLITLLILLFPFKKISYLFCNVEEMTYLFHLSKNKKVRYIKLECNRFNLYKPMIIIDSLFQR